MRIHTTVSTLIFGAGLVVGMVPGRALAQQNAAGAARTGIMIMAHGGDPKWDAAVVGAVTPLKARIPTALALGMADPTTMQAALDSLQSQGVEHVAVVRLFLSGESFLHDTEYYLHLREDAPAMPMALMMSHGAGASHGAAMSHGAGGDHGAMMSHGAGGDHAAAADHGAAGSHADHGAAADHTVAASHDSHTAGAAAGPAAGHDLVRPLDLSAEVLLEMRGLSEFPITGSIVADRAAAVSTDPSRESVIVVAHGMGDEGENQRVLDNMEASVELLRSKGFKDVWATTLREDWPEARVLAEAEIREWVGSRAARGDRVIVVPFRLFGFGGYAEILGDLPYVPADGLLPHPLISTWIEESAADLFCAEGIANPLRSCSTAGR